MAWALDWMKHFEGLGQRRQQSEMNRLLMDEMKRKSAMRDQPIHREPPIQQTGGGMLGDIMAKRGMVKGYESPMTRGTYKEFGFGPEHLSERDIEGLGGRVPPERGHKPSYDWFVDKEGNIVPQRKDLTPAPGTKPHEKRSWIDEILYGDGGLSPMPKDRYGGAVDIQKEIADAYEAIDKGWDEEMVGKKFKEVTGQELPPR